MLQKVATTGVDLDSVYDQTLQRIREQTGGRSRLGIEVLMWVSHAEWPLGTDELCHALAVEMDSTDLDPENIPPQDTVIGSCLGLVVVEQETLTVRLIHYTLQEYLSRPGVLLGAHKTLGETCLAYLNYDQVKGLPVNEVSNLGDMPFLEYSSLNWGSHAKMELSDHGMSLALGLLNRYDNHISASLLFKKMHFFYLCSLPRPLFTSLHCASYFGIGEVVAALVEMGSCDINQEDCRGFTPLIWAARQGNEGVVRLLLARDDVNPDKLSSCDQTLLSAATSQGLEGVLRLLLVRDDIGPDKPDRSGHTPLWWAAFYGHEGVARLLLARDDVDLDKLDHYNQTPLLLASSQGREGVMRLLFARDDVDPDKPGYRGRTPLWRASSGGHEGAVGLLLARDDVNLNMPDNDGQTSLSAASSGGHDGVVRLLLTHDGIDPNKSDSCGQTPLWWASFGRHEGAMRLLLARDDVNPNTPDIYGETPLEIAYWLGHMEVVELLRPQTTAISSTG